MAAWNNFVMSQFLKGYLDKENIKMEKSVSEIISTIASVKAEAKLQFRAEIKGIFGSYVRGEQKEGSDLDVLVEFEKDTNLLDLTGLADFLEEKLNIQSRCCA